MLHILPARFRDRSTLHTCHQRQLQLQWHHIVHTYNQCDDVVSPGLEIVVPLKRVDILAGESEKENATQGSLVRKLLVHRTS